jgi:hypothetical protein
MDTIDVLVRYASNPPFLSEAFKRLLSHNIRGFQEVTLSQYTRLSRGYSLTIYEAFKRLHCPKGFPTLPVYTGNVEDQTPHGR